MAILVGELDDLVLDTGAVPRTATGNLTAVHRRPIQVVPNQLMDCVIGVGDPAGNLVDGKNYLSKTRKVEAARRPVGFRFRS